MRIKLLLMLWALMPMALAQEASREPQVVTIPYMERAGLHREYADALLHLVLELSTDKYGPYQLAQQTHEIVIRRQLLELTKGDQLSVAVSMPTPEWLSNARMVPFPIMKGLASYRLFFVHQKNLEAFNKIDSLDELKQIKIGQSPGWSTSKILEDNGFLVVNGPQYQSLFSMLAADRFQLLMRGVYEIKPELDAFKPSIPELAVIEGFAVYTYLPMYFFVAKNQPELAERLEYGLHKAHKSGQFDQLFDRYFRDTLELLNLGQRTIFYVTNTNIDPSFYERDKPYLLDSINELEQQHRLKAEP